MSKRPTTKSRKDCSTAHNSSNSYGYVIIGDTVSAVLYAKRLIANKVTAPIYILTQGVDRTNIDDIPDVDFPLNNTKRILHYLAVEKLHSIPPGDNDNEDDDEIDTDYDKVIHYNIGVGPLGDFIGAYFSPRVGPWFPHSSSTRLEKFLNENTKQKHLSTQEITLVDNLALQLNIAKTSSMIVKTPSILNTHYVFVNREHDKQTRELFLDAYHYVNQTSNVDIVSEVVGIKFEESSTAGLYNVTATSGLNTEISAAKIVWKTNPYTYLRTATAGGLDPKPVLVPTFYRAVLSIPKNAGNVDLTNATVSEDLISSHLTFSLYDMNNPKHSAIAWICQAYTTTEDVSEVHPAGKYADTSYTLLIVEGVCTKNKRKATYNNGEHEVQINHNDKLVENGWLLQFAKIVSAVNKAYTGATVAPESYLGESSICTSGTCQDGNVIVDYSLRESPMVSVLELAGHMYGLDIYPSAGKC